jgi:hypothetical protein
LRPNLLACLCLLGRIDYLRARAKAQATRNDSRQVLYSHA